MEEAITDVPIIEDLRFGYAARFFASCSGTAEKGQLDLIEEWFPGLVITVRDSGEKLPAEYDDLSCRITASRVRGKLYLGDNSRITQIVGRLSGTAKGNQEKERRAAELIRRSVSRILAEDDTAIYDLLELAEARILSLDEDGLKRFCSGMVFSLFDLAGKREAKDGAARDREAAAMDDEVFGLVIYNAAYQLHLETFPGAACAFLWILLGGFLRNEAGRIARIFDSGFIPAFRAGSEDRTLSDKLNYLFFPEEYYSVYGGDDLEKRFPGIAWYCDECHSRLDEQPGFDDHFEAWQCRVCGHINPLSEEHIFKNEEACRNGEEPMDPADYRDAIARAEKQSKRK